MVMRARREAGEVVKCRVVWEGMGQRRVKEKVGRREVRNDILVVAIVYLDGAGLIED